MTQDLGSVRPVGREAKLRRAVSCKVVAIGSLRAVLEAMLALMGQREVEKIKRMRRMVAAEVEVEPEWFRKQG